MKLYKSGINSEIEILKILLEHGEKIIFWKKIQGFGLKETDVAHYGKFSRRKFNYRKAELIKCKLITQLNSSGKKDKFYSITPLGIVKLCNESQSLDIQQIRKILYILKNFEYLTHHKHENFDLKLLDNFLKEIPEKTIIECLQAVFRRFKLEESENWTAISFMEDLPIVGSIVRFRYLIYQSKIYREYNISNPTDLIKASFTSDSDFYHGVGTILIDALHLELYYKLKSKKIPLFYKNEMYVHCNRICESLVLNLETQLPEIMEQSKDVRFNLQ